MIISGQNVNQNSKVLIIAEAGINHDGNFGQALQLIDAAVEAKADVVKFQLFKASKMYTKNAGDYVTAKGNKENIVELLEQVELPYDWIPKLMEYCKQKGIGFLCTVCDEEAGDELERAGSDAFKMASYAITHLPLMKHVAKKQKPVIFSSAGANISEVENALNTIKGEGNHQIVLMHCVAKYPAPLESTNMNVLDTFKNAFPDIVLGYSDHTEDPINAPVAAVLKGAKVVEKHFTIDKNLPGADHCFALNPNELKMMVNAIRDAEQKIKVGLNVAVDPVVYGSSEKKVYEIERTIREFAYRCIFATKDLKKGQIIDIKNTAILRPGESKRGIEPKYYELLLSRKVKVNKDIESGNSIKWEDVFNL